MSIKKVFRTPHLPQIVSIYSFRSRFSSLVRSLPPPFRVKNRESPQCGSFPLQFNSYHAVFAFKQFLLHLNCHAHHGKCLLSQNRSNASLFRSDNGAQIRVVYVSAFDLRQFFPLSLCVLLHNYFCTLSFDLNISLLLYYVFFACYDSRNKESDTVARCGIR